MVEQGFGKYKFAITGLSADTWVERFQGDEGISQLFQFDVDLVSHERDIAFADVVGRPALLTLETDGVPPRYVHGIVSRFEQGEEGPRWNAYHATLVPKAWRLLHRHDARIFQELKVPDILEKVLKAAGLSGKDYRLSIEGSHPVREYCVQYRETDWAFMSRLMEEEGIFCFFEHHEDSHVLVIGDGPSAYKPIEAPSTLVFRTRGAMSKSEGISRFFYAEEVRPGKVTLTDFDFKKPSLSLLTSKQAKDDTDLEVYDYPGEYEAPGDGATLAKVRLEEQQAVRKTGVGETGCMRFTPGYLFTMSEHGRDEYNRKYLITRAQHTGAQPRVTGADAADASRSGEPYRQRFQVIPDDVPFRPVRRTERPTVKGVQTAIVVGPPGEEIHTDEHGRIKVQFHWDRQGKHDDKSSCWMRVSQLWAGAGWGAMFIPRVGQEVIVDFIEGDPDRPIVLGRVYHGTNVPPYSLPAEKTKSTVKSNSTPGGGGSNELRFEDKKGKEEVYLHGQKDWTIKIEHDKNQTVGHDETHEVDHDRTKTVQHDETETVGNDRTETVTHDRTETTGNDRTEVVGHDHRIEIANDRSETIGSNYMEIVGQTATRMVGVNEEITVGVDATLAVGGVASLAVGAGLSLSLGGAMSVSVGQDSSETISKGKTSNIGEGLTTTIGKDASITVGADSKEEVKENKTMIVGKKMSLQCGDATITVEKDGTITVQGKKIVVKGDGPILVDGKKIDVKSDGAVNLTASGMVVVKGSNVAVN